MPDSHRLPCRPEPRACDFCEAAQLPSEKAARAVQYFEPNFIDEALVLLDRYSPGARVLAGGTILGLQLRAHPDSATAIINVKRIPQLRAIALDGDMLSIGALATAHDLMSDDLVRLKAPLVARAAALLGARQLRNVATIGGNLCSGHPAADLSAALLASDARCISADVIGGPTATPVAEFFRPHGHALEQRGLLTAIEIPVTAARTSYQKMQTRRAFDMALVAVALSVELDGEVLARVRIAIGGAAPTPLRAVCAEAALAGKRPDASVIAAAAQLAASRDAQPQSDARASAEYRRHLVAVLTRRALEEAL